MLRNKLFLIPYSPLQYSLSFISNMHIEKGGDTMAAKTGKSRRGFASMPQDKQRSIASKGGKAAHAKGTAHEFTSEEARAAGRKGGQARQRKNRS